MMKKLHMKPLAAGLMAFLLGFNVLPVSAEETYMYYTVEDAQFWYDLAANHAEDAADYVSLTLNHVEKADQEAKDSYDYANQQLEAKITEAMGPVNEARAVAEEAEKALSEAMIAVEDLEAQKMEAEKRLIELKANPITDDQIEKAEQELKEAEVKLDAAKEVYSDLKTKTEEALASYNTAAENRKNAEQSLIETEENVSKAKDDLSIIETELEEAKDNLKKAEAESGENSEAYKQALAQIASAQEALEAARSVYDTAKQELDRKQAEFDAAEQIMKEAEEALAEAEEKNAEAQEALKEAKEKKETAEEQSKKDIVDYNQAVANAEKAHENVTSAENDLAAANQELEDAKAGAAVTGQDVEEAEAAVAAAEQALADAKAQIALGSTGFFAERDAVANEIIADGIEAAREYLQEAADNGAHIEGGITQIGAEGDATSLENMKASLAYIRQCNELRTSIGMRTFDVSDRMMAYAQTHANMSAATMTHWSKDSKKYNTAENLAIGTSDPFAYWWYEEKKNYEEQNGGQTGHYTTLINKYTLTGYAINTVNGSPVHTQEITSAKNRNAQLSAINTEAILKLKKATVYTIDEYEAAFMEYYNRVMGALTDAEQALADAQANLEAARNGGGTGSGAITPEIAAAEAKVAEAEAKLDQAKADAEEADALVVEKEAAMEESKRLAEEASSAAIAAESNVTAASEAVETAKGTLTNSKTSYENAINALNTASKNVENAEIAVAEKQNALDDANADKQALIDKVNDAKARVAEKEAAVSDIQNLIAEYEQNAEEIRAQIVSLMAVEEEKQALYEAAVENLAEQEATVNLLQSEYDAKQVILEELKNRKKEAEDTEALIGSLISQIEAAKEKVKEAEATLQTAKDNLGFLQSNVDALEDVRNQLVYNGAESSSVTYEEFTYLNDLVDQLKEAIRDLDEARVKLQEAEKEKDKYYDILQLFLNAEVTVDKSETKLIILNKTQLKPFVSPSNINQQVKWTSSDESVATVDSNGIVTAHKYGRAQIICTAYANPEKYAVCDIHTLFRDVDSSSMYFYDPVYWAADNAITVGTGKGKFSPEETCSRAQIVTFLWRMMGEPEVDYDVLFTDVAEDRYFYKAVAWAASTGVTTGTSPTTFSPDESCTRAQIVTFLWRAMGKPEPEADAQFEDVTADRYFYKAVSWAAQNNVTKGTSATRFSPDNKCTRAQAVTFLYRTALLGN